jgi:hypothetical protein
MTMRLGYAAVSFGLWVALGAGCSSGGTTGPGDAGGTGEADDAGGTPEAGATGCARGTPCASGLSCCTGIPYPSEGVCNVSCNLKSDRASKQDISPANGEAILSKLARLQVSEWAYREEPGARHVGPMAQDFHALFGLGGDDKTIPAVDANGVTIAALQALLRRVETLEDESRRLRLENEQLRAGLGRSPKK